MARIDRAEKDSASEIPSLPRSSYNSKYRRRSDSGYFVTFSNEKNAAINTIGTVFEYGAPHSTTSIAANTIIAKGVARLAAKNTRPAATAIKDGERGKS